MVNRKSSGRSGQLRIIGGTWRGRRIALPPEGEVRPTGDRIRETLFNWLMPVIDGARCLDLFAGTGALGIEALSRGAREVVFVERGATAASQLSAVLDMLECHDASVVNADALRYLRGEPSPFDIVWLDPPFGAFDLANLCTLLDVGWLAPGAQIYLELSRQAELPDLPEDWAVTRDKTAGQVRFTLVRRN